MTTDVETAPPPPSDAGPSKSSVERLTGVLFSPDETFADIARRPNVLLPLAVLLIVSVISVVLLVPKIDFESTAREQMERSPRAASMSPGDMERAVRIGAASLNVFTYISPAVAIIIWAIIAGVFLIAFRMFGGDGNYKQAFAVTLYAWFPLLIKSIITTVVAMTRTKIDFEQLATLVTSNPAFLLDMKQQPVAFAFLATFDIFAIWAVILFIVGLAHVSRMSKAKSATIVITLWAVLTFFRVAAAAYGAMKMKTST